MRMKSQNMTHKAHNIGNKLDYLPMYEVSCHQNHKNVHMKGARPYEREC